LNPFGGGRDTQSQTARQAFRKAKFQNGIPLSQKPLRQYYTPDKHNPNQQLRTYDFKNSYGKPISIRKDIPVSFYFHS
jgi:hypothetical protein